MLNIHIQPFLTIYLSGKIYKPLVRMLCTQLFEESTMYRPPSRIAKPGSSSTGTIPPRFHDSAAAIEGIMSLAARSTPAPPGKQPPRKPFDVFLEEATAAMVSQARKNMPS
jgi:hypothetical protein